ncbi:MAG: ATP-binding protein, partial [Acidimicrobiales bacterium]
QEALTNTIKHAGPSQATVHIRYRPDEVVIVVTDDGRGLAATLDSGTPGHGLIGMRERVALYGGTLSVGPRSGGGFQVSAHIPYDRAAV